MSTSNFSFDNGLMIELSRLGYGSGRDEFSGGTHMEEETMTSVDADGVEAVLYDDECSYVSVPMDEIKKERALNQAVLNLDELVTRQNKGFKLLSVEENRKQVLLSQLNTLVEGWNTFLKSTQFSNLSRQAQSVAWDKYKANLQAKKMAYWAQKDKVSKYWDRINEIRATISTYQGEVWAAWYRMKDEPEMNAYFTTSGDLNENRSWEIQEVNMWDEYAISHVAEEAHVKHTVQKFVFEIEAYGLNLEPTVVQADEEQFLNLVFQEIGIE